MEENLYYENAGLWGRTELTVLQEQVISYLARICDILPEDAKIADLGCGDGIIISHLASRFPKMKGYGIDFSQEALEHLPSFLNKKQADLSELPFPNDYFDLCFCIDVLEHIMPDKLDIVISEIHRVSRGPILLVSPYLESEAIRTICPHCSNVFSPYYHVNRFSVNKWEDLIQPYLTERKIRFVPLGNPKPHLPKGIGMAILAAGGNVIHQHDTLCPQCKTKFSRSTVEEIPDFTNLLSAYASNNKDSFGWVYEEMGVLSFPNTSSEDIINNTHEDGLLLVTRENQVTADSNASLFVRSKYEIDFNDATQILNGADLFRSPAYLVNNGCLEKSDGEDSLRWRPGKDGFLPLRIVLPPSSGINEVHLSLQFSVPGRGCLRAYVYSLETGTTELLGQFYKNEVEHITGDFNFIVPNSDATITPYGILVDLVWKSALDEGEKTEEAITLFSLSEKDRSKRQIEMEHDRFLLLSEVIKLNNEAVVQVDSKTNQVFMTYDGRLYDLTGQLIEDREKNEKIYLPLFKERKEDFKKSNNSSADVFRSIFGKLNRFLEKDRDKSALVSNLSNELIAQEQKVSSLEHQIGSLEQQMSKMRQQMSSMEQQKSSMEQYMSSIERDFVTVNQIAEELKKDLFNKIEELRVQNELISSLQIIREENNKKVTELLETINSLNMKVDSLETDKTAFARTVKRLTNQLELLNLENKYMSIQIKEKNNNSVVKRIMNWLKEVGKK